jgi:hypothetical protein
MMVDISATVVTNFCPQQWVQTYSSVPDYCKSYDIYQNDKAAMYMLHGHHDLAVGPTAPIQTWR